MGLFTFEPSAEQVTAASMSRLYRHITPKGLETGVVIVSASRTDRALKMDPEGNVRVDQSENDKLNGQARKRLEAMLKQLFPRKGWIRVKGGYRETREGGEKVETTEHSYLIPGVNQGDAKLLARKVCAGAEINGLPDHVKVKHMGSLQDDFRQDSILWGSGPAGAYLVDQAGKFQKVGDKFTLENIGPYFTKWRGYRFAFGSFELTRLEYCPTGPSDFLAWRQEIAKHATAEAFRGDHG